MVEPYCEDVKLAPEMLLELEATDDDIRSILDDDDAPPYGVPVMRESSGFNSEVVTVPFLNADTFYSNSLINVFLVLN